MKRSVRRMNGGEIVALSLIATNATEEIALHDIEKLWAERGKKNIFSLKETPSDVFLKVKGHATLARISNAQDTPVWKKFLQKDLVVTKLPRNTEHPYGGLTIAEAPKSLKERLSVLFKKRTH